MKKRLSNTFVISFFSIIITVLSSCCILPCGPEVVDPDPYIVRDSRQKQNIYYVPTAPNTPLHTEKNDINLVVLVSSRKNSAGADAHASFMLSDQLGFLGSYSSAFTENVKDIF